MSNCEESNYRIESLRNDNYESWTIQAQAILIRNNLWEYVSGEKPFPQDSADGESQKKWKQDDLNARSELLLTISPSELKRVKNCPTSKSVWDMLKRRHLSKQQTCKVNLLKQLVLLKMDIDSNVREHLNCFLDIIDKLRDMEIEINSDLISIMMLYSLSDGFENFRVAIESRDTLPKPLDLKIEIIEEADVISKNRSHLEALYGLNNCNVSKLKNGNIHNNQPKINTKYEVSQDDNSKEISRFNKLDTKVKLYECLSMDPSAGNSDSGTTSRMGIDQNQLRDATHSFNDESKLASVGEITSIKACGAVTIESIFIKEEYIDPGRPAPGGIKMELSEDEEEAVLFLPGDEDETEYFTEEKKITRQPPAMPRKFQQWSGENMVAAVAEVLDGSMGYRKASKLFNVPQSTLERRVKKARVERKSPSEVSQKGMGIQPIFTQEQEKELVNFILLMESRMFNLTLTDIRRLAYELAMSYNIKNNFNKETKTAGKEWLHCFLKRNPMVALRSADAQAMPFNKVTINSFFDLLDKFYNNYQFSPEKIFNVDVTGVSTAPDQSSRILGLKGRQQIGGISAAERGNLTSVVVCMSASGCYMPPMFIFPQTNHGLDLLEGSPPGSTCEFHPSGLIQVDLFLRWFERFVTFANPTENSPALLILDGNATYVKNLKFIQMAREHHVVVLCLPPYCSHRLQPLDVSFMRPLSSYYSEAISIWLREHPGKIVTIRQIAQLFAESFLRTSTIETAINGFCKTGIYPLNMNVFDDSVFTDNKKTE